MSAGKTVFISIITALLTSGATFFAIKAVTDKELFGPERVTVPALVNLRPDQARQMLEPMGLTLVVSEEKEDSGAEVGRILSQSPLQGIQVAKATAIQVVISKGKGRLKVPTIVGLPLRSARQILASAGLQPGPVTHKEHATAAKDQVLAASPLPGTEVDQGSAVSLVVSSGSGAVSVPKVVGRRLHQARKMLADAGLAVGKVTQQYDEDQGGNVVLSQNPAAGASAAKGAVVDLVVNESD